MTPYNLLSEMTILHYRRHSNQSGIIAAKELPKICSKMHVFGKPENKTIGRGRYQIIYSNSSEGLENVRSTVSGFLVFLSGEGAANFFCKNTLFQDLSPNFVRSCPVHRSFVRAVEILIEICDLIYFFR